MPTPERASNAGGVRKIVIFYLSSFSSCMRVMNHNWPATKQHLWNDIMLDNDTQLLWSINTPTTETSQFQWPWMTPNQDSKVTPLFNAKYLRNSIRQKHSYNGILIGLNTPDQDCHFKWCWVTWQNIQWHETSHNFSATAELFVVVE